MSGRPRLPRRPPERGALAGPVPAASPQPHTPRNLVDDNISTAWARLDPRTKLPVDPSLSAKGPRREPCLPRPRIPHASRCLKFSPNPHTPRLLDRQNLEAHQYRRRRRVQNPPRARDGHAYALGISRIRHRLEIEAVTYCSVASVLSLSRLPAPGEALLPSITRRGDSRHVDSAAASTFTVPVLVQGRLFLGRRGMRHLRGGERSGGRARANSGADEA